jgi:1,2-diacylglycerol 3-alpha-glucosyltransferase
MEQKRKLLIATDNFLPRWDGIARFLSEIIPRLLETYDITVIAPDYGSYEDPNIRIIKIPLMKNLKVGDFRIPKLSVSKMRSAVRDADIVFSQTIGPVGASAIYNARKYKKPIAAFTHSIEWELVPKAINSIILKRYMQFFSKTLARRLYNKCNILIMPSNSVAELFMWNNIKTETAIVNLGVDTQKFRPQDSEEQRNDTRLKLGITANDIVIGYHGRIGREKDLITLLRAFSRIQNYHDNIKLLIVGEGLESIKKQLSARKDVILTGAKNNPVPYLQSMEIYCLTSLTETTCLSMLEAMSCGLACISTEVGFIKNYIKDNYNGLFFEKQNPYHLARNIDRLIKDDKLRKTLGINARKTVINRFSWDKTAKGIIDVLEVLERKQIKKT